MTTEAYYSSSNVHTGMGVAEKVGSRLILFLQLMINHLSPWSYCKTVEARL